jgi:hypothetical protein
MPATSKIVVEPVRRRCFQRALRAGRDPQAQIRLASIFRPGENSCCYLIAHGELRKSDPRHEARHSRAVSKQASRTSRSAEKICSRARRREELIRRLSARGQISGETLLCFGLWCFHVKASTAGILQCSCVAWLCAVRCSLSWPSRASR